MTEKSKSVKFGTPPPKHEPRYDWAAIASRLRRRPEEWALVFKDDRTTLATAVRSGSIKVLHPHKGFVVRTANNKRGTPRTCDLWLKYVPELDQDKEK